MGRDMTVHFSVLTVNTLVMLGFSAISLGALHFSLRRRFRMQR